MPKGDFTSEPTGQCPDLEGLVVSEVAGAACGLSILVAESPAPGPEQAQQAGWTLLCHLSLSHSRIFRESCLPGRGRAAPLGTLAQGGPGCRSVRAVPSFQLC